jgi:hypothetical protein
MMADLGAQIRARLDVIGEGDDDCRMQCGRSCAEDGYDDVARALLAVVDRHKPHPRADGMPPYCDQCAGGYEGVTAWPCPTVLDIAKELGIEVPE